MKTCCAGHDLIAFGAARCPLCEHIEKADKIRFQLTLQLEEISTRVIKLTNEKVSNLKDNWNGGAS